MGAAQKLEEHRLRFKPAEAARHKILPYGTVLLFDKQVPRMPKPFNAGGYLKGVEAYGDRLNDFAQMNRRLRKGGPFKARMSEGNHSLEIFRGNGSRKVEEIHVDDLMIVNFNEINYVIGGGYLVPKILGKDYEEDIRRRDYAATHPLFQVAPSYAGRRLRSLDMECSHGAEIFRVLDEDGRPVSFEVAPPPRRRRRK